MGALQSTNYDCHEFLPSRDSSVHSSFETLDDLDEEEEQGQGQERIINSNRDDSETDSASEEEEEEDGPGDDNDSDTDADDDDDGEPAASPARDEEPLLSCSALLVSAKDIVIFLFFLAALYYGLVWGAVQLARLAEELFFAPYGSVLLRHHKDSSAGADSAGGGGEPQVMREEL